MRRRGYITPPKVEKEQKKDVVKAKKPQKGKKPVEKEPDGGQENENTE